MKKFLVGITLFLVGVGILMTMYVLSILNPTVYEYREGFFAFILGNSAQMPFFIGVVSLVSGGIITLKEAYFT